KSRGKRGEASRRPAGFLSPEPIEKEGGGHQVEMRPARILEQGGVFRRGPARSALRKLVVVRENVFLPQRAGADGAENVAHAVQRRLAAVHENACAADAFIVGFACTRPETADEIEMLPRLQPFASKKRLTRHRGG